ncbi:MAG: flagellar protein FlgN [Nitrospirota bacterium]|nr:flagellar protein FlgN [Nitrospirota bacterium]
MGQAVMTGHDLLARLLETLGALRQRTQSFADLLTRERQAIKALATDQLISLNEAKLRLLKELSTYEDRRKDIVEQLAALWKIPADSMTIGSIADRTGGPVADQLKRQQAQLNHSIVTMKRSNQVTGAVLQKSLTFLHEAIGIMRAPFHVQLSLYSESGSMQARALEGGLLERRG